MKIILTEKQIQNAVNILADDLTARHSSNEKIVMICLLKGGFMFFSDLTKQIKTPIQCDFMRVKSYVGKHEQGDIQILKDIETPIKNKIVYVVDDFFDTGNTMDAVVEYLSQKQPKQIEAITLLTRDISPLPEYRLHYGHIIRDEWVVGYGLDNNGLERNLPYIYSL
jgi:hypoxanthine phosphoribosyltransferase